MSDTLDKVVTFRCLSFPICKIKINMGLVDCGDMWMRNAPKALLAWGPGQCQPLLLAWVTLDLALVSISHS